MLRVFSAIRYYVSRITKKLAEDDVLFLASGLAFNGILTLIPILLLGASALGVFLNSSQAGVAQINEILDAIFPPQPFAASIKESILAVISDIISYRHSIGLFAAGFLLWTAMSLFSALRSALHRIYRIDRSRSFLLTLLHDLLFIVLVMVLLVISNGAIWASSLLENFAAHIPVLKELNLSNMNNALPTVVVVLLTAFMFYIVYRHIADTKPPRAAAVIATITTTVLWILSGKLFALYLVKFSSIGKIYGTYAFVLVLLVWIYYSCIIFLIGGVVGQTYWERRRLSPMIGAETGV